MHKNKIQQWYLVYGLMYFKNENDDGQENGKSMHTTQIIPDCIVLLVCHPRTRYEDKEEDIHY